MDHQPHILDSVNNSAVVISSLNDQADTINEITNAVINALKAGHKILTAGHGGSAADALHMSEELLGRFDKDRRPLPAVALVADTTLLTCIANDYGFNKIFPRQVEGLGQPGDCLVIFSTSGNGDGLKNAVQIANQKKMTTIALLGKTGGDLNNLATHQIIVQSDQTARIQEAHTLLLHIILEAVDREFA